ncbi:uncharacterized protein LOC110239737 [Exaiptasia diaphana]|uniref:Uncharacterized protein n=1 Tax=Exaiptasia diaphana TaxID=2652724 RepID=A0A913X9R1_EXADI|nr:uncharacterized protein LOC110239737 [Exaiptasia diaphana]KXJ13841.1 hypothetical protein AC249_AIPGENE4908 [Exaiptasia diaphana]
MAENCIPGAVSFNVNSGFTENDQTSIEVTSTINHEETIKESQQGITKDRYSSTFNSNSSFLGSPSVNHCLVVKNTHWYSLRGKTLPVTLMLLLMYVILGIIFLPFIIIPLMICCVSYFTPETFDQLKQDKSLEVDRNRKSIGLDSYHDRQTKHNVREQVTCKIYPSESINGKSFGRDSSYESKADGQAKV